MTANRNIKPVQLFGVRDAVIMTLHGAAHVATFGAVAASVVHPAIAGVCMGVVGISFGVQALENKRNPEHERFVGMNFIRSEYGRITSLRGRLPALVRLASWRSGYKVPGFEAAQWDELTARAAYALNGNTSAILVSPRVVDELTVREQFSLVGHEMTHRHRARNAYEVVSSFVNTSTLYAARLNGCLSSFAVLGLNFKSAALGAALWAGTELAVRLIAKNYMRSDEYACDRGALAIAQDPESLKSGLRKIQDDHRRLCPDLWHDYKIGQRRWLKYIAANLFHDHPHMDKRIEHIDRLAYKMAKKGAVRPLSVDDRKSRGCVCPSSPL